MTSLYADSSAVLRWLLGTPDADALGAALAGAQMVVTSALTSAEVGRTLRRLVATAVLEPGAGDRAWERYSAAAAHWHLYAVTDGVLARAAQPFPREPLRTLDAIHLATAALFALEVIPPTVLSVDQPVRDNAQALGLAILPGGR